MSDSLQPHGACQVPLSMGFSREEYWSGLLFPSPGDLPDLGIEPASLMSPAFTSGFFTTSTTSEAFFLLVSRNYFHWKNLVVVKDR